MTDHTGRDYARAQDTHPVTALALPAGLLATSHSSQRQPIAGLPLKGFQIEKLLTHDECSTLVGIVEKAGFKSISWEYDPEYRSCTRLVANIPELAAELWRRLRPHLHLEDITEARPFGYGVGAQDIWRPYGVNECIRFTKYQSGDHFAAHRDGPFVRTDDERSVYTVMVYLNDPDQYTGGETVFYSGNKSGDLTPERGEQVARIRGSKGAGLVFQHEMFHSGAGVTGGVKYILRTDLMFVRVATCPLSSALRYADETKYREAEKLYQESIRLQKDGKPAESTMAYLAALDIHASLEVTMPSYGPEYRLLPADVMADIFSRLPLRDVLFSVWCVSRGWRALARHPSLWKRLYRQHFRNLYAPADAPRVYQASIKTPLKDWHTLFRTRWVAKHQFQVVFADIGNSYTRYGMLGSTEMRHTVSTVKMVNGHYWSAGSGLGQHVCGTDAMSWLSWYEFDYDDSMNPTNDPVRLQIFVRWLLLEGFPVRLLPQEHPLLLACPPLLSNAQLMQVSDVLRTLVGVPCVSWLDPAICSLAVLDRTTGLVLSVDQVTLAATAVVDEKVVARSSAQCNNAATWQAARRSKELVPKPISTEYIEQACKTLCTLVKTVFQQLSAENRAQILEQPVLRGIAGPQVRPQLEKMLNVATEGAVSKLDDRLSYLVAPAMEFEESVQGTPATLDIYMGLEKLCGSVSRAQQYFASVEPPVVSFNHTLLLLVLPRQNTGMLEYEWRKLQGWDAYDRDYSNDIDSPVTTKQVKVFKDVATLQQWAAAFEAQLAVAARKELVRVAWIAETHNEAQHQALLKWRETVGSNVLLLMWTDKQTTLPDHDGIFYIRRQGKHIYFDDYTETRPPHRTWKTPAAELGRK